MPYQNKGPNLSSRVFDAMEFCRLCIFRMVYKTGTYYKFSGMFRQNVLVQYLNYEKHDLVRVRNVTTGNVSTMHYTYLWYGKRIKKKDIGLEILSRI